MSPFNTPHEKKSAVKTAIIMSLLILSFFWVGLTYMDPPEEMGVEVNFGTSDVGSGTIQPLQNKQPTPQPISKPSETRPTETTTQEENLITQDEDSPVSVPDTETKPKPDPKVDPAPTPEPEPEQKPDESTTNILDNIIGSPSDTNNNSTGDGEGAGPGDQGHIDGNPYANAYYGGGSGNGTGYGLGGRSSSGGRKFVQDCNEEGRVVVKIIVNKQGKVIKAIPGVKGSTNTAPCLREPAKKSALSYRFNPDSKAPTRQIGFIVVNFSLGN